MTKSSKPSGWFHPIESVRKFLGPAFQVIGTGAGRYFGDFKYMALTLLVYVALCGITYTWLAIRFGTMRGSAATIAFDVATGGTPLGYNGPLTPFTFLWIWLGVLHILSWLLVPTLVASAVDAMYRLHEQEKLRTKAAIRDRFRRMGRATRKLSGAPLEQFVNNAMESLEVAAQAMVMRKNS